MKKYRLNLDVSNKEFLESQSELKELISKKILGNISNEELKRIAELNKNILNIIDSAKQSAYTILKNPLGERIGSGQDNLVFNYRKNWVVKVLYEKKYNETLLKYYQYKYKLLKRFVGDYIPDTYFFDGEIVNLEAFNYKKLGEYKLINNTIYSIQRKINGYTLKDLPLDIRKSDRLYNQLKDLHRKYIRLKLVFHFFEYQLLGKIMKSSFKMDLGKLSNIFEFNKQFVLDVKTPNVMWDLEKNKLFLVDFDSGNLDGGLEKVFEKLFSLPENEFIKISDELWSFLREHKYKKINKEILYRTFEKIKKPR